MTADHTSAVTRETYQTSQTSQVTADHTSAVTRETYQTSQTSPVTADHTSAVTSGTYRTSQVTWPADVTSDQALPGTESVSEESIKPSPETGLSAAIIAGVVALCLLLLIVGVILILCYIRK